MSISPPSIRTLRIWLILALFSLVNGCASTLPARIDAKPMLFRATPATVFVADGAGNYQMATKALRAVTEKDGYPIDVITHEWSHGNYRIIADQIGYQHARAEGKKLARAVLDYHAQHPQRPIYLLGHSAGAMITLTALENLPPNIVERAVLLSPSVSRFYEVRPALQAVKQSMHVFYSPNDYIYLGMATNLLGTLDRRWTATAGRIGFRIAPDPGGAGAYSKLVQRPWQPSDRELGNNGGHYGNYQPDFLRAQVISLLNPLN